MQTTVERLLAAASNLPEAMQIEVLDFAEFLSARRPQESKPNLGTSLLDLCGGLESSQTFAGSPLALQKTLRDEWT
jgi:Protein of unknown function (DUF2281)